jgi:hypothetical protein
MVSTKSRHSPWLCRAILLSVTLALGSGCGEPSRREVDNARSFEALLTSITLRDAKEMEKNARRVEDRHAASELSASRYRVLERIIAEARRGEWEAAEKHGYEFRAEFGDEGAYFK